MTGTALAPMASGIQSMTSNQAVSFSAPAGTIVSVGGHEETIGPGMTTPAQNVQQLGILNAELQAAQTGATVFYQGVGYGPGFDPRVYGNQAGYVSALQGDITTLQASINSTTSVQ